MSTSNRSNDTWGVGVFFVILAIIAVSGTIGFLLGIDHHRATIVEREMIERKPARVEFSVHLRDMVLYKFNVRYRYTLPTSLKVQGFDRKYGINDANICIKLLFAEVFSNHTHEEFMKPGELSKRTRVLHELRQKINGGGCPGVSIQHTSITPEPGIN